MTTTTLIDRLDPETAACELCNAKGAPIITKYGSTCRPCAEEIAREDRGYNPTTGWR